MPKSNPKTNTKKEKIFLRIGNEFIEQSIVKDDVREIEIHPNYFYKCLPTVVFKELKNEDLINAVLVNVHKELIRLSTIEKDFTAVLASKINEYNSKFFANKTKTVNEISNLISLYSDALEEKGIVENILDSEFFPYIDADKKFSKREYSLNEYNGGKFYSTKESNWFDVKASKFYNKYFNKDMELFYYVELHFDSDSDYCSRELPYLFKSFEDAVMFVRDNFKTVDLVFNKKLEMVGKK